jgi:hypothetical protein
LNLKATFESNVLYDSVKRLVPGTFNVILIGSTCIALPGASRGFRVIISHPSSSAGLQRRRIKLNADIESSLDVLGSSPETIGPSE